MMTFFTVRYTMILTVAVETAACHWYIAIELEYTVGSETAVQIRIPVWVDRCRCSGSGYYTQTKYVWHDALILSAF